MHRMGIRLRLAGIVAIAGTALGLGLAQVAGGGSAPPAEGHSAFAPFDGSGESTHCPDAEGIERNKANIVAYYTTAFNDHDPEAAVAEYGGADYTQHNPQAANGFDAFVDFVTTFAEQFPDLNIDIVRVFAECDFVITHGVISGAPEVFGEQGNKVVDIFRLDEDGKVIEHWDVLSPIAEESLNGNPEV